MGHPARLGAKVTDAGARRLQLIVGAVGAE